MGKKIMEFDVPAWRSDAQLGLCKPATRGIWMDAITAMHDNGESGELVGSLEQLAKLCRCNQAEMQLALDELQGTSTAHVSICYGIVTLRNRRMWRKAKQREQARLRMQAARKNAKCYAACHADVTSQGMLFNESVSFVSKEEIEGMFVAFWKAYPRKENPVKARVAFEKAGITSGMLPAIFEWLDLAKRSEQWQKKDKIPHPATWLNQRRWLGDPPPLPEQERNYKPDMVGAGPQVPQAKSSEDILRTAVLRESYAQGVNLTEEQLEAMVARRLNNNKQEETENASV